MSAAKLRGPLVLDVVNALSSLKFNSIETMKILQIQQAAVSTPNRFLSGLFADTDLKVTVTPNIAITREWIATDSSGPRHQRQFLVRPTRLFHVFARNGCPSGYSEVGDDAKTLSGGR